MFHACNLEGSQVLKNTIFPEATDPAASTLGETVTAPVYGTITLLESTAVPPTFSLQK